MIFSLPLQASVALVVRAMAFCALGWASWSMAADPVASAVSAKPDVQGAVDLASAFDGLVLVTPLKSKETVLVDGKGKEVHIWTSAYEAAAGARLLPDGSILRIAVEKPAKTFRTTGLQGGRLQRIGWNGEVLWDFWNAATYHMVVGDATILPNGNVLMLVAEYKSQDDVLALGRDRDRVTYEGLYAPGLMEFEPKGDKGGRLVWRWSAWDYVSKLSAGTGARLESGGIDINSDILGRGLTATEFDYDSDSDKVLLTLPALGEAWVIEHRAKVGSSLIEGEFLRERCSNEERKVESSRFAKGAGLRGLVVEYLWVSNTNGLAYGISREQLALDPLDAERQLNRSDSSGVEDLWTEKIDGEDLKSPTAIESGPIGGWLLTRGWEGTVELLTRENGDPGVKGRSVLIARLNPEVDPRRDGAKPMVNEAPLRQKANGEVRTLPVPKEPKFGRSRYYQKSYLKLDDGNAGALE